jgi:PAS domain S-box-containing protein
MSVTLCCLHNNGYSGLQLLEDCVHLNNKIKHPSRVLLYKAYVGHLVMQNELLNRKQESYRILIESVKDFAVIILDPQGYIISWNKGAEIIKGYTADEIIGKHFSVFYTDRGKEAGEPERNLQKAAELGRFEDEGWRLRKDGSLFWANVVFTTLTDEEGQLIGYGKVTRDLTARKKAQKEIERRKTELEGKLQKSEMEVFDYKHALNEAAIVAITDQKGTITHVNDNFCKISKYSREELIGQDHRIINSGHHSKEFIRNLWVTIANGEIWRGELKNKAKDGSFYWVDTTIVPFLDEKGKPYQYLAIRSDITQRKIAEEKLYRINEELESKVKERTYELTEALEREVHLNEMKSRFVSMASHEFRTPLSAILSSVSLIEHYTEPEQAPKRDKHIERIKSSVKNLTNILDDFLSLEKLEQGRVDVHGTDFNLQSFVEDVIEEMDGMIKRKFQTVHFYFEGETMVCQDKKILRNVLLNLLSNAVKYSPEEKDIWVQAKVSDDAVKLTVKDEGIGIPLESQQYLFGKFYRADNAVNVQGTGLGLHIVKRYVDLMEGNITFTSVQGNGTTFTLDFPKTLNK